MSTPPETILIVGHGVFGLSTALALTTRPFYSKSKILLLDRSPFPSPDGSSIDSSRIIRADYQDPSYTRLATEAQSHWRSSPSSSENPTSLSSSGTYHESGLLLVSDLSPSGSPSPYVLSSYHNVQALSSAAGDHTALQECGSRAEIEKVFGVGKLGPGGGEWGYLNKRSGWADAEGGMKWLWERVKETGRIEILQGEVSSLIISPSTTSSTKPEVKGIHLNDGQKITADLTILATGAWTPSLIDLSTQAQATGQVLAYITLTDSEQAALENIPVLLNMSTGLFVIPPKNNILKIARHGYGYTNPQLVTLPSISSPTGTVTKKISVPYTTYNTPSLSLPSEAVSTIRQFLSSIFPSFPSLSTRAFTQEKLCWYTDTPTADFLITYHPEYSGLFLATGGSGHGYKFLPVIGQKIVDCMRGEGEWVQRWGWKEREAGNEGEVCTEDGSRGGKRGMVLEVEMERGGVSRL